MPSLHRPNTRDPYDYYLNSEVYRWLKVAREFEDEEKSVRSFLSDPACSSDCMLAKDKRLAIVQRGKYSAYNHAIATTIELFHLAPKIISPIEHSDAVNLDPTKPWMPHFSEREISDTPGRGRPLTNEENRQLWVKAGSPVAPGQDVPPFYNAGTDRHNASIGIFRGAFSTPETLATAIYHETVHWLNDAALGRPPNPYESYLNEIDAYQKQIDSRAVLGESDKNVSGYRRMQKIYEYQMAHINPGAHWSEVVAEHPDFLPLSGVTGAGGAGLDGDESLGEGLAAVVAESIRKSQAEAGLQADELRRVRDGDLRERLGDIAMRACANPDDIDHAELGNLPVPYSGNSLMGYPGGMSGLCEQGVYMYLSTHLSESQSPSVEGITGIIKAERQMAAIKSPPTLPPSPPLAPEPNGRSSERDDLGNQMQVMRAIARKVCSSGNGIITDDDARRYRFAYDVLQENLSPDRSGVEAVHGIEPRSALDGLDG